MRLGSAQSQAVDLLMRRHLSPTQLTHFCSLCGFIDGQVGPPCINGLKNRLIHLIDSERSAEPPIAMTKPRLK